MQIDQQLPRVITGTLILAIEGNFPEAWHSHEPFEVEHLYFALAEIEMPLVSVDKPEVGVKALRDPSRELPVVDRARIAQYRGKEMLLLLGGQQVDLLVASLVVSRSVCHLPHRPLPSFVDELKELDLVRGKVGGVHVDPPKDVDIFGLDRHRVVAAQDDKLEEVQELALGVSMRGRTGKDVLLHLLDRCLLLPRYDLEGLFDLAVVLGNARYNQVHEAQAVIYALDSFLAGRVGLLLVAPARLRVDDLDDAHHEAGTWVKGDALPQVVDCLEQVVDSLALARCCHLRGQRPC